jgi:membrane protease YdiL (CAAX protease family)
VTVAWATPAAPARVTVEVGPVRRRLGHAVTGLAGLVLAAVIALATYSQMTEPRIAVIEQPERALALIVGRTMDVEAALRGAQPWERRIYALTITDGGAEIRQAIAWYEELTSQSLSPDVDLRLGVLLGEAGEDDRLRRTLDNWRTRDEPFASFAELVGAAYLGDGEPDIDGLDLVLETLGTGWFADVLLLRLAAQLGDGAPGDVARQAIADRAAPLLWRLRALVALDGLLLGAGVLAAIALWRRRARGAQVAAAPLPPPWTVGRGVTALVRGGALAAIALLVLAALSGWLTDRPLLAGTIEQPLMYVPVLLLAWRTLLVPAGVGFAAAFGLRPRAGSWGPLLLTTAALVGAGIVVDIGLGVLGERLGLGSHWTEWFEADLAWGGPSAVAGSILAAVVFAPLFEELIFRGALYGTLRVRLRWPVAAVASALIFAAAHGYGLAGFGSVLISGVLWSWAYERTGSLLPGMLAHAINNLAVSVTLLVLLRA